jgi:hypothetical protein
MTCCYEWLDTIALMVSHYSVDFFNLMVKLKIRFHLLMYCRRYAAIFLKM